MPSYMPVMEYLEDESIRKEFWEAGNGIGSSGEYDNTQLIKDILALRQEKAEILDRKNFADLVLEDRMAKKGKTALDFVNEESKAFLLTASPVLCNHIMHNFSMHIGQAIITTAVAIGQPLVVQAHEMQNRRMKIMHMDPIFNSRQAKLVSRTITEALLHAAPAHKRREPIVIVIAPLLAFRCRSPSEFTAPNHQCLVQKTTLLQVGDQRRDALIAGNGQLAMTVDDVAVSCVPGDIVAVDGM